MANHVNEITGAVTILQDIFSELFTVVGLVAIIVRLDFAFALLIGTILAIKAAFIHLMQKRLAKRRLSYAQNDRIGNYLNGVAYFDKGAAKELRLNNLGMWFMGKIHAYRDEMLELQYGDFKRYALFEILLSVAMAAQTFFMLWLLSAWYIRGIITIADFTMYFSAVTVISSSLSNIIEKLGEYHRLRLYLSDFDNIRTAGDARTGKNLSDLKDRTIRFERISFAYPGSERLCLDNVSIEIPENEKLAIVGENGAGKSTLVKLLCHPAPQSRKNRKIYRTFEKNVLGVPQRPQSHAYLYVG